MGIPPGQPMQAAAGPRIALLDVSKIFKNHARFKGMMEDMKADVQRAESEIRKQRDEITKLEERLQEFRKGTPDYKRNGGGGHPAQGRLDREGPDPGQRVPATRSQNLLQRVPGNLAGDRLLLPANSIDMVLQFNGDRSIRNRPDSVMPFINKQVVWSDPGLDITDADLAGIESDGGECAVRGRAAGSPFNNNQPPQQR